MYVVIVLSGGKSGAVLSVSKWCFAMDTCC